MELSKQRRALHTGIVKLFIRRILTGFKRSQRFVKEEYENVWESWQKGEAKFMRSVPILGYKNGALAQIIPEELQISNIRLLADSLRTHDTVLELGSGVGVNILALSLLCPEVKHWEGIDLTAKGVEISSRNLSHPPVSLLSRMTGLSESEVSTQFDASKITFRQGSILELPYDDNSFDAVFSHEVFEQIPHDYRRGFKEAFRVTKRAGYFLEGFRESDRNLFQFMHKMNVDYFRASVNELTRAGFKRVTLISLPLSKAKLGEALAVAEKS